jgi:hypothetical protein
MSNEKTASTHRAHAFYLTFALLCAPALALSAAPSDAAANASAPDSTAPARDPFLAPPPHPLSDSGMPPETAPMEAVKLSTQGHFTTLSPRVGDSLDYVVEVEWEDTQVPVIVLAPDSVDFPGFKVIGQATVHKKLAAGASVRNHTEFVFRLRAQTQGSGKAASMKLRYLTGLSRAEEAVFIPTALIDIQAAPVRVLDTLWFKILMLLVILGGAGALGLASFKLASRKRADKAPKREDLSPAVAALKNRLRSAQNSPDASKEIILEMERLATRFLRYEIDAAGAAKAKKPEDAAGASATAPRFESLLASYLASPAAKNGTARGAAAPGAGGTAQDPATAKNPATVQDWAKVQEDWAKLGELFKHARFAGGYKEPHELQDAFRTFRKCLKITGEDQHD